MKKFTKLVGGFFAVALLLFSNPTMASHFKGGDTYFVCTGNGYYKLVFACYYACESGSSTPYDFTLESFTLTSSCPSVPTTLTCVSQTPQQDVPLYCPGILTTCDYNPYSNAPTGTPTGTLVVIYQTDSFQIPPGCTVTAEISNGNRNGAITNLQNPANTYLDIAATITTPMNGSCNNNPQFAQYPVNVFCLGQNANFSQGAIDASGDSLVYTLINPRDNGGLPIPFVAGCTPADPLGALSGTGFASTFSFNSSTGNINFTPTASGNFVLTVEVDAYHNGVFVGSVMRDIQFTVTPCNDPPPPVLTSLFSQANVVGGVVIDSNHVGVCPGQQVQINLIATTTDSFNYLIDSTNAALSLPGAIVSVTHAGTKFDSTTLHITWTPSATDSGYHYILVTVKDTICPRPGSNTYAFVISVLGGLYAGPDQVYCNGGSPVIIQAAGANHYIWTDSATGGPPVGVVSYGPDSSYIVVAPSANTGYVVQGDLLGSCKNRDTVSVKNAQAFTLRTVAQDTTVCKYSTTVLTTTPTPGNLAPFTYVWAPAAGLVSPTSSSTTTGPILSTGYYYVTATSFEGCAIRDSIKIFVNGAAPRVSILPNTNYVCPGDTISLRSSVLTENLVSCGVVDTLPSSATYFGGSVNNDTSSSTGSFGFTNVNCSPFMGSMNSYKVQYLFRQSELNAAGLSSGTITDISFFIKALNSTVAYDTFAISMGCTNLNSLNGFVNNLTEVVPPQIGPAAPTANVSLFSNSWNPIPFTRFYNWDGASNIVIQICYTINSASSSNDDFVSYSTTSFPGSCVYAGSFLGENGCSLGANSFYYGVLNTRPNIKMDMVAPDVLTYHWSPATALCDTCPSTAFVVTRDTTVTLTVSDGTCINDSTKRLLINPAVEVTALRDTVLCSGSNSAQLNVVLDNPSNPSCIQGYSVAPIPYAPISVTTIPNLINPASFVDAFGNPISTDNGTAGPLAIGFNFPFYCQNYSQFYVNSNGWISFVNPYPATSLTQEYTAQTLPPSAADLNPQKVIELMMGNYYLQDLFGGGGGTVLYFVSGTAPNRVLAVQFSGMFDASLTYTTSGEIDLYEGTGVIDIQIQSSDYSGTNHTTGVKDSTGLGTAAPGRNNQPYTVSTPEAWRFTPQYGASVVVGSTVWSPNLYLNNDSIANPIASPPNTPQTYVVTTTLILNPNTVPTTCVVTDSVHIGFGTTAGGSATVVPGTICLGDTAQLAYTTADVVTSYTWTPARGLNDSTISAPKSSTTDTTIYYVRVVNNQGCVTWAADTVNIYPPITVTLPADAASCNCHPNLVLTPTIVGGTPAYSYHWSNGGTDATTVDTILNGSSYILTVTDAHGCTAVSNKDSFTMSCPLVNITVDPVSDTIFMNTDTATLTANSSTGSNFTYQWWSDSLHVLSPATNVTGVVGTTSGSDSVHLIVTDINNGCIDTTAVLIHVINFGSFVMPTAFTPNGDLKNPYFYPVLNGPNSPVRISALRIYSRWGQLVYDNPNAPGWDGNFGSNPQPSETYLYFVTAVYPDPNNPSKTVQKSVEGSFQLQR
jgi:gliding motility-associated-like protein